jgi:heat shock protein HtpX
MRWGGVRGSGRRGGRDRDGGGGIAALVFLAVWALLVVLAPLLAQMMAFAVSRTREYDADASAAEFTRNPLGLASALRKLDAAAAPTTTIGRGNAHLCIADPAGREVNDREGGAAALFATHPPIEKRIAILESMAGAGAPVPAR